MPPRRGGICGILTEDLPLGYLQGGQVHLHALCPGACLRSPDLNEEPRLTEADPDLLSHPGVELRANLKGISHRCYLFEVAFVWELTEETIDLPLGCLQGGLHALCPRAFSRSPHLNEEPRLTEADPDLLGQLKAQGPSRTFNASKEEARPCSLP